MENLHVWERSPMAAATASGGAGYLDGAPVVWGMIDSAVWSMASQLAKERQRGTIFGYKT